VGIACALAIPFMSLFLTTEVHASPFALGAFLLITPIATVVVSTLLTRLSDARDIRRTLLIVATIAGIFGYVLYAFLRNYWALLALVPVTASLFPQLFAYARQSPATHWFRQGASNNRQLVNVDLGGVGRWSAAGRVASPRLATQTTWNLPRWSRSCGNSARGSPSYRPRAQSLSTMRTQRSCVTRLSASCGWTATRCASRRTTSTSWPTQRHQAPRTLIDCSWPCPWPLHSSRVRQRSSVGAALLVTVLRRPLFTSWLLAGSRLVAWSGARLRREEKSCGDGIARC
jgi:hypothetical protein